VPATVAAIPCEGSLRALVAGLTDPDGFLRYKIIEAIGTLRRTHPQFPLPAGLAHTLLLDETGRYYTYLTLRANLVRHESAAGSLVVRALDDKLGRALDRVYRVLGLIYPWQDVDAARRSREGHDPRKRAHAIEYLDNLLTGPLRRRVMPILDDLPEAERVRQANAILRSRPRDLEDTLAQLIHEPDPVVAAAAIALARAQRLWSLSHDFQYVIDRRSSEHAVADAAAWALASTPDASRASTPAGAPQPIVGLVERLRAIPLFDFVSVDELFRIAETGSQVRYETGHTIIEEGATPDTAHFLIEGTVGVANGASMTEIAAPAALSFNDILEGRPTRGTVTATVPAVSLSLGHASLLTMMSDNIVLARGFFRALVEAHTDRLPADIVDLPPDGQRFIEWRPPLEPFEKAGLLRQTPILGRATVEQLLDLVGATRDVPLAKNAVLFAEGDASAVYYVLAGRVVVEHPGAAPVSVGPGGMIGMAETLAGLPVTCRARVDDAGHALRLDQESLFEVLADHVDLVQGLFSGVLRASLRRSP
jgi:CRP-like cAMP-binding protein